MELKYDIYMLNNAQGTGEKRQYIRIVQHEPMTEKQLQEKIQSRCSLTKGDVAAVLAELHDLMVEEFICSNFSQSSPKPLVSSLKKVRTSSSFCCLMPTSTSAIFLPSASSAAL